MVPIKSECWYSEAFALEPVHFFAGQEITWQQQDSDPFIKVLTQIQVNGPFKAVIATGLYLLIYLNVNNKMNSPHLPQNQGIKL